MDIKILYWEINSSSIGLKKLEPKQIQSSGKKKKKWGGYWSLGLTGSGAGASRAGDLENLWDGKGQGSVHSPGGDIRMGVQSLQEIGI